jgi:HSP20 family protein
MANITRWDPLAELTSLQDRFNQLLRQPSFFRGLAPTEEQPLLAANFVPPVDIYEDEHTITLFAELPGVEENDVHVTLEENDLILFTGERKMEHEEKKENFRRLERSYGKFTRSFTLPSTVDKEKITAEFNNGVLKIVLNKLEAAKPKQIKIGIGKGTAVKPTKAA